MMMTNEHTMIQMETFIQQKYKWCVRYVFVHHRSSSVLTSDIILHRQILELSGILHLGFREYHKLGNLDRGWQSAYTVNMLFLPSSLHISALRKLNPISSLTAPPKNLSLLKHAFNVISLRLRTRTREHISWSHQVKSLHLVARSVSLCFL